MASLTKAKLVLTFAILTIQTASSVHAQGRMGMIMGRQMMMNGGMTGGVNSSLLGNPFAARGFGFGRNGGGVYAELYGPDYSYEDNSQSKQKKSKYRIEEVTLSPEEERERLHQIELTWSQSDLSELQSQTATALNVLLDDLRDLQSKSIQTPDAALDTQSLCHINVLVRRTNGNAGVLKNNGQLDWPKILQGPEFQSERELISRLAPQVIEQARLGQVTDLARFAGAVEKMHRNLHAKIADIPTPTYIRAKRFLAQLDDAIKILRQPDAGNYFNQTYAARGNTVGELVRNMTLCDLHFAPAIEGDAPAYHALHQVLEACDRAAHEQAATWAGARSN